MLLLMQSSHYLWDKNLSMYKAGTGERTYKNLVVPNSVEVFNIVTLVIVSRVECRDVT